MPMIIFFITAFSLFNRSQQSEFNQSFATSALKTKSSFELIANSLENFYNTLSQNSEVIKFLDLKNPEPSDIDRYEIHTLLKSRFNEFKANHPYVDSVCIYSTKSDYVLSNRVSVYRSEFPQKNVVDGFLNGEKGDLYFAMSEAGKNITCLAAAYPFCLNYYDHFDGLLIINIDCDKLSEYVTSDYTYENLILFSKDGKILNKEFSKSLGESLDGHRKILQTRTQEINSSEYYISREKDSVLCYIPLDSLDMIMALQIPSEYTKNLIDSFALTIFVFIAVMLLIVIVISFYTSLVIYKSIANIVSEIGINTGGETENTNEASFISDRFLSVLKNNSDIEKELTEKVLLLKKSQTLALQTQINPHFVFNTLNLVNLMIIKITQQDCAPSKIISLLTDIMYYSFKTDKFIASLDEELSYTQKYIQIEQIKYHNSFDYEFFVENSVKNCKTVKFCLQPIIENCVEHGIKKLKDKKGKITLKAFEKNGCLHIIISDNGVGMTNDKLEALNKKLKSNEIPTGKHIGLANVNQRIQLIFGKEYGIAVNPKNCGVEIELTQPIN